MMRLERTLDLQDSLTSERMRFALLIGIDGEPLEGAELAEEAVAAVCSAIAYGQHRFGIFLSEMPERREAIEASARSAFETSLHRRGHPLLRLTLLDLSIVGG
jgi:hypothetical protein